jgi:hypothetical protein
MIEELLSGVHWHRFSSCRQLCGEPGPNLKFDNKKAWLRGDHVEFFRMLLYIDGYCQEDGRIKPFLTSAAFFNHF